MNLNFGKCAAVGAVVGLLVPGIFYGLKNLGQLYVSHYFLYESLLLVFWPSSFALLPFERIPWVGVVISVLINAAIYAVLATSLCGYLRSRVLLWLAFPGLYLVYCFVLLK